MERKARLFLLLGCLAVVCGCVSSGDLSRVQHGVVERLELSEKSLADQGNRTAAALQAVRTTQADQGVELATLKSRIRELHGALEELRAEIATYREVKANVGLQGDRMHQFHNRLSIAESNIVGLMSAATTVKTGGEVILTKRGNATHEAITRDTSREDMAKLYETAYALFKKHSFDRARAEFSELLRRFPNSEYSADATFWVAETYFLEKRYEKAILEYEKVIKNHPKSKRVASAMLKQGMAFVGMGEKKNGGIIFRQIVQAFPGTPQAKSAQQYLNKLR